MGAKIRCVPLCSSGHQRHWPAVCTAAFYYIIMTTLKRLTRRTKLGCRQAAADVKPEMEEWIRGAVANAEGALARLTIAPLPPKGTLTFTTDLNAMAGQVDFI